MQEHIRLTLGVERISFEAKYLGLPTPDGTLKRESEAFEKKNPMREIYCIYDGCIPMWASSHFLCKLIAAFFSLFRAPYYLDQGLFFFINIKQA